ncbi:hypothetical protein HDEF_1145 [Candidatus Hamiltonella defensa 5AT (Acyrthosiphon pisum)]|uniref:Uncharacterized protein n=1 Tax=Hamiltonella defensa subsp. Acyrthosiphon pisum (strain 5AT) TaxID=572265 RepID=C4K5G9_HAMD5|nr:hypothetical protein HDEF_1145 [Candidatus Hamiltonella defensa 5AT (Acyrthosiphon pisum)]
MIGREKSLLHLQIAKNISKFFKKFIEQKVTNKDLLLK